MAQQLDLTSLFRAVTRTLKENQASLNEADDLNHNHGDNMVQTFSTISRSVAKNRELPVSEQLLSASEILKRRSKSGSGQIYAQGLERASKQFQGKDLNADTVGALINAMMGGGVDGTADIQAGGSGDLLGGLLGSLTGQTAQPTQRRQAPQRQQAPSSSGDLLDSLLGGLSQPQPQQQSSSAGGSLLDSLLGSLGGQQQAPSRQQPQDPMGGLLESMLGGGGGGSAGGLGDLLGSLVGGGQTQSKSGGSGGMDMGDLLSAGLRYYTAKQRGKSDLEAIMSALSNRSPLGQRQERKQSGALVIDTILNMLGKAK